MLDDSLIVHSSHVAVVVVSNRPVVAGGGRVTGAAVAVFVAATGIMVALCRGDVITVVA